MQHGCMRLLRGCAPQQYVDGSTLSPLTTQWLPSLHPKVSTGLPVPQVIRQRQTDAALVDSWGSLDR
eukprot:3003721-Pyramimonas_sp.AAC.1